MAVCKSNTLPVLALGLGTLKVRGRAGLARPKTVQFPPGCWALNMERYREVVESHQLSWRWGSG